MAMIYVILLWKTLTFMFASFQAKEIFKQPHYYIYPFHHLVDNCYTFNELNTIKLDNLTWRMGFC